MDEQKKDVTGTPKTMKELIRSPVHPDALDPEKDFFEREGARPGERGQAAGCGLVGIVVGVGLSFFYPVIGIPIAIFSGLALLGSMPNRGAG